ncbi:MAG: 2'-5' RNA ligase [Ignavibacteria bacterium]|nr:MAG: 2'-5' RNA ligase [Ignavibacteria bacterium]KAF0159933.1 MAG: 2'-5' RNA ligase [Ignavibacteria bacterium]
MIRLFVALEIPENIISAILIERNKVLYHENNFTWEPKEKLHITLKFLGNTEESLVDNISHELKNIVRKYKSINLVVSKFGVFRKGSEPKILWVGMHDNYYLSNFVNDIEKSFCKFGCPKEERKFKPHITLLRFRGNEDTSKILSLLEVKFPVLGFMANNISLIKSELKQSGSVYTTLKNFKLEKQME